MYREAELDPGLAHVLAKVFSKKDSSASFAIPDSGRSVLLREGTRAVWDGDACAHADSSNIGHWANFSFPNRMVSVDWQQFSLLLLNRCVLVLDLLDYRVCDLG